MHLAHKITIISKFNTAHNLATVPYASIVQVVSNLHYFLVILRVSPDITHSLRMLPFLSLAMKQLRKLPQFAYTDLTL